MSRPASKAAAATSKANSTAASTATYFLLSIIASLSGCAAHAHKVPPAEADVQVIDRVSGERLPLVWHDGRRYVAGTPGHRYAIEVGNRSGGRVLAVVSVDGINAVTGATAGWDQNGYVFAPGQRWQIAGWRKSQSEIAAFEFTRLDNTYAARTGRPANVGVIGVAFFRERPQPVSLPPISTANQARSEAPAAARSDGAAAAPAADANASAERAREKIGTGHGRIEDSQVALTDFERARETPDQVITIYYDSRDNLIAQGILPPPSVPPLAVDPFPGSARPLRFVADPPG